MKTEEDEAFEDIERRQSGFYTKRQMAMHKTQDQNICRHYKQWQHCHICDLESQVAELASIKAILDEYGLQAIDFVADFKAALAQPAQEPVAHLWECLGRWSAYLVSNGKQADCAPPSWLVEAVQNATTTPKPKEKNG
jgi:hypothetical protein